MAAIRYFVAGNFPKDFPYEESFFMILEKKAPDLGSTLHKSPKDCKSAQLEKGMDPDFFERTARIFKVTVEEVK
jgi:hypothetical protein